MTPSHNKKWLPEYAKLPKAELNGETLKIYNLRDFNHLSNTQAISKYINVTYDLNNLEGLDFVLSYWDNQFLIAHTMLIFRFKNAENLVVSAETRREVGEDWNTYGGFINQFELIYVLGTETDLIKLRTNIRNEDVFVYPVNIDTKGVKQILLNIAHRINEIYKTPEFYNAAFQNCTSSLLEVSRNPDHFNMTNIKLLFNGFSDHFFYSRGDFNNSYSYWDLKTSHYVTKKAKTATNKAEFSKAIH
jgi:hypothetical protein